ncbi:MAG: hypothetical protein JRI91_14855, partial [Deltaproteobacteria bacterium]|nr:hypothetical protein [Deltaproteobacteria bacterium]
RPFSSPRAVSPVRPCPKKNRTGHLRPIQFRRPPKNPVATPSTSVPMDLLIHHPAKMAGRKTLPGKGTAKGTNRSMKNRRGGIRSGFETASNRL